MLASQPNRRNFPLTFQGTPEERCPIFGLFYHTFYPKEIPASEVVPVLIDGLQHWSFLMVQRMLRF